MAALTLDAVSKIYGPAGANGIRAVDNVDMDIGEGEIVGLLGSSGCGKTSTLRMIAGFESVTEGEIRLGERVINTLAPARRNVAMAFEGYALYPPLRIRDNIGFALLRQREPKAEVQDKVREIARLLDIEEILDRYPPTVSAGQQQRTSLARALIRRADAFLLDEPMSQLEPQLRAVLRARIKDWLITNRMTTVFVTHDQTEAIALADRIAVMEKGMLMQFASPEELKERPANLFVAGFIGEPPMNLYQTHVVLESGLLTLRVRDDADRAVFDVRLPSAAEAPAMHERLRHGQEVHLGLRPHRVQLGGGEGAVKGTVSSNHWLGDQSHIGIVLGRGSAHDAGLLLIAVANGVVDAPLGSEIELCLTHRAIHLFDSASGDALFHGPEPA